MNPTSPHPETDFCIDLTAAELRAGLHAGQWSCVELSRAMILHAKRLAESLNSMSSIDEDWVLMQAKTADQRLRSGERNEWLGLPITIKDNIWVEGRIVSNGSTLFRDFVSPRDAVAVARMRAAGAVVLGHTLCSEFACKGVTSNILHGTTRNPWDVQRTPGGSSGGAASATAAGIGCLALTTDAGGSTRRPAAHTGVVGMKPSAGIIPHPHGFPEPVYGNSVIGQMARSVKDIVSALATLAGVDAADPQSASLPTFDVAQAHWQAMPHARIGYSPRLGLEAPVDPDVATSVRQMVALLSDAGHEIIEINPSWPDSAVEEALMPLQHAGLAAIYGEAYRRGAWEVDPDIATQIESGFRLSGIAVAKALEARKRIYDTLHGLFQKCDLLITPTTPVTAWPLGQLGPERIDGLPVSPRAHAVFTPLFNHCYLPACSVPCGLDRQGLPIGLQIVGPIFSDSRVLAAASWVEHLCQHDFTRIRAVAGI